MALTKEDLQAIRSVVRDEVQEQLQPIKSQLDTNTEKLETHTGSIMRLEKNVMHELKILSENLPNAIARSEKLNELGDTVENHDQRIFALEQVANK